MRSKLLYRLALLEPVVGLAIILDSSKAGASPNYQIQELGLSNSGGTTYPQSTPQALNDSGQAIGASIRSDSDSDFLGTDSWFFNGTSTQQIGLHGGTYSYPSLGGTYQQSQPFALNNAGQVIGGSYRFNSDGSEMLGEDSWYFNGTSTQQIGLISNGYSYSSGGGTYESSSVSALNSAGAAIGNSNRYDAAGDSLGADSWLFNGTSTQQVGLTGGVYSYSASGGTYQSSAVVALNNSGQVVGTSNRYDSTGDSLGADSWISNGSANQPIGLTGGVYSYSATGGTFQSSSVAGVNDSGQAIGSSNRFSSTGSSLGADSWLYNGTSTQQIGLTGTGFSYAATGGTYQLSSAIAINSAGKVVGESAGYDSGANFKGTFTWLYNGTSSQAIGLNGGIYNSVTTPNYFGSMQLNNAGQVVGNSPRYDSSGNPLGQDTWFFNGTSTRQIGLTGTGYSYAASNGTYQYSSSVALNNSGQAIGISSRYDSGGDSLGQDGWFFDNSTGNTSLLQFSVETGGYSYTNPAVLTDTGVVLGNYELFDGSTDEGEHAFYWSLANGFSDLGTLINGGLSAAGWESLLDVIAADGTQADGSPQFILGDGLLDGASESDAYLLSPVPEPTAGAILLGGAAVLCLRRRVKTDRSV
jgi:hypothetical protein